MICRVDILFNLKSGPFPPQVSRSLHRLTRYALPSCQPVSTQTVGRRSSQSMCGLYIPLKRAFTASSVGGDIRCLRYMYDSYPEGDKEKL